MDARPPSDDGSPCGFGLLGGQAQQRYEALRAYVLLPQGEQRRATPARFALGRFARFGLLGLLDWDPAGTAWGCRTVESFQVELVPVGTKDAAERAARLYALLYSLISTMTGGDHVARCAVRSGVDGTPGEGADDPEPVGGHLRLR